MLDRERQYDFLKGVLAERKRQDEEWGGPEHDDKHTYTDFMHFIRYQLGQILLVHGGKEREDEAMRNPENLAKFRERMLKVAALACAAVESMERKAGK